MIGFFVATTIIPVTPQSTSERGQVGLSFDVASVKTAIFPRGILPYVAIAPNRAGGRIAWTTDLWYMIGYAHRLEPSRLSGPIPGSSSVYSVEATFNPDASDDQVRLMFQSLLKDRFRMAFHTVTRDVDGYALSVAAGGLKIKEVQPDDKPSPLPDWIRSEFASLDDFEGRIFTTGPAKGVNGVTARRVSLRQFCEELQRLLQAPVMDQTGIKGNFYFSFLYGDPNVAAAEIVVSALSTAIEEELGLKLIRQRAPFETLVVDHIEKIPTPN
jgi:uncharacterized protein (TIGR03435 family)